MDNGFDDAVVEYLNQISGPIDGLVTTTEEVQAEISKMIQAQIQKFETKDGRFIASQDFQRRMLDIDGKFEKILSGKLYTHAIKDYLSSYSTIEETTINLHRDYNDLMVAVSKISPARKVAFEQAKSALYESGIRSEYKQPVNHMLMVQVTTGGSISDMETLLSRWTDGDLSKGSISPTGKPIPNLKQYAGQLASDASYGYAGTIQNIIQDEYGLDGINYVGDVIRDSRPLCVYLVNLKRNVSLEELSALLKRQELKPGRIPGTTVKNFCTYRGGYRCRHMAFPIRLEQRINNEEKGEKSNKPFAQQDIDHLKKNGIGFTNNGRNDDKAIIEFINKKLPNFDPVDLINRLDQISEKYSVTWKNREFDFDINTMGEQSFLHFVNSGRFEGRPISLNRRFYLKDGKPFGVYHQLFEIPLKLQGKHFAKEMFAELLDAYKKMGLKEITVTANINVGGYAWANYGFEAKYKDEVLQIYSKLERRVENANGEYKFIDNKGKTTLIKTKEVNRIAEIITAHYEKSPDAPFPMNLLSRRKSGKALLLDSWWSGTLDLKKKRKLRIFEDYLKKR